ncbi:MAG: D-alanyl-D-alanine endopeptidase [Pseudomonadota bacterium]|nr:D-alanyl-D-alanine endopeptidase [Pseudomonadota bacterium]
MTSVYKCFDKLLVGGLVPLVTVLVLASPARAATAEHHGKKKSHGVAAVHSESARAGHARRASRHVAVLRSPSALKHVAPVRFEPARPSFGQLYGLHNTVDALDLKSSVALVLDADTDEVLFSKNPQAVLPIASLTKLMTAVVVTEAKLPLAEPLTITDDDVDTEKNSRSRLRVGTTLSREEMLHLALMSSENRAAHALGRTYPGGLEAFVAAMNAKAQQLGMNETHYVEPTGLSSRNQSSARDLAALVKAAQEHRIIREFSTSPELAVEVGNRLTQFHTTDALVRSPAWDILLQKTGYITEAGRCLVMQARMAGRKVIMVFLDSAGSHSHIGDAERVRRWVAELPVRAAPAVSTPAVLTPGTSLSAAGPKVAG